MWMLCHMIWSQNSKQLLNTRCLSSYVSRRKEQIITGNIILQCDCYVQRAANHLLYILIYIWYIVVSYERGQFGDPIIYIPYDFFYVCGQTEPSVVMGTKWQHFYLYSLGHNNCFVVPYVTACFEKTTKKNNKKTPHCIIHTDHHPPFVLLLTLLERWSNHYDGNRQTNCLK